MEMKICSKCGISKFLTDFQKDASKKNFYRSYCKECGKNQCMIYRQTHKQEIALINKKYRVAHVRELALK